MPDAMDFDEPRPFGEAAETDDSVMVPLKGRPKDDDGRPEPSRTNREALKKVGQELYGLLLKDFVPDVSKLKDAFVDGFAARAQTKRAEALKTVAEAARTHEEADAIRRKSLTDADLAQAEASERRAEAVERVAAAISKIRQQGGDVAFTQENLKEILGLPKDAHIPELEEIE